VVKLDRKALRVRSVRTDGAHCSDDEVLVSLVCASGATDGAKCAMPGTAATALCVRK